MLIEASLIAGTLVGLSQAFWRLPCNDKLGYARLDPITASGAVSSHEHGIYGGNGFNATMTYATARSSTCSTCYAHEDLSNYWAPTLYYVARNGTVIPVEQDGGILVYYLQRWAQNITTMAEANITAFPPNFSMLAGNASRRSYDPTSPADGAISWACLNGTAQPATPQLPSTSCDDGLRAQIFFPSCWDGIHPSSPHNAHVAYPDAVGHCPPSHSQQLISIFFEITWQVAAWADPSLWWEGPDGAGHPFVLSNGDTHGYSLHGDFFNGWDVPVLQEAIETCTDNSGDITKCTLFTAWDPSTNTACKMPKMVSDPPRGLSAQLPGCNPVPTSNISAAVTSTAPFDNRTVISVTSSSCIDRAVLMNPPSLWFTDYTAAGWSYAGCAPDPSNAPARTLPDASDASDNMTIDTCLVFCASKNLAYAGLEYGRECWCGAAVASNLMPDNSLLLGGCQMTCGGDSTQVCGGSNWLTMYHACPPGQPCVNAAYLGP